MARKAFNIKVELDVQAITCPGVWLCSTGQVSLQLYMLDSCVQTTSYRPVFPMLFHEEFSFKKTLPIKYLLDDLNKELCKEWLYMELIQWETCNSGNVLAYFQIPLNEILYPSALGGVSTGAEVDLLMEPTSSFPGALAPKVEVCTKTTLQETICSCGDKARSSTTIINPKVIVSAGTGRSKPHSKAVCHSMGAPKQHKKPKKRKCAGMCRYYRTCGRPPFRYRKVEDDFLARQPVLDVPLKFTEDIPDFDKAVQMRKVLKESMKRQLLSQQNQCQTEGSMPCPCGKRHSHPQDSCTVCSKYSGVFNDSRTQNKQVLYCSTVPDYNLFEQIQKQSKLHAKMSSQCQKKPCGCGTDDYQTDPCLSKAVDRFTPKNLSLAKKLHERISKTLHSVPKCLNEDNYSEEEYISANERCACDRFPNMGKFYKSLYEEEEQDVPEQ